MPKRALAVAGVCLTWVAIASADTTPGTMPTKPTGKLAPNAQNVVPATAFVEAPDFPFAPKSKLSMWKRMVDAMKHPFTKEPLPPGTVPTPGMLPTVGPRPPATPPMRDFRRP